MLDPDIATFAVNTKADLPLTEETLLILAEDNVVSLKEKETEITYDSVEIKTNQESIQRKIGSLQSIGHSAWKAIGIDVCRWI